MDTHEPTTRREQDADTDVARLAERTLETERQRRLWSVLEDELERVEDIAHDALHVLRVTGWALRLAPEAGCDVDLAGATALVHDLVAIPKDHPDRHLGGTRSAQAAPPALREAGYETDEIEAIVEAVRTSSWSRGFAPTSPLGRVLQEADRLDAIGAIGIARCIACAQSMAPRSHGRFYDPLDPVGARGRELNDRRNALDHFRIKLLRLVEGFELPTAREEAMRRQRAMLAWLDALLRELASSTPEADAATLDVETLLEPPREESE